MWYTIIMTDTLNLVLNYSLDFVTLEFTTVPSPVLRGVKSVSLNFA